MVYINTYKNLYMSTMTMNFLVFKFVGDNLESVYM